MGARPAPHRRHAALRRDRVGELMAERPAAHLRPVKRKGVEAEGLGSGKAEGHGGTQLRRLVRRGRTGCGQAVV